MKIAIYPGSFDPVTNGHVDIIRRAVRVFDRLIVVVASNVRKETLFTMEERVALLRRCTSDLPNVRVDADAGLIAHYAQRVGAMAIVKGLRAMSDFDYEFQQALTNRKLNNAIETVFFAADGESMFLSSSMVKQVFFLGGDVSGFVPPEALNALENAR